MVEVRSGICKSMQLLEKRGLNIGTSGNISVRRDQEIFITPSGVYPADLDPEKIVSILNPPGWNGNLKPSSEWQCHLEIYSAFPEAGAVVHVHSPYATALSCHGKDVPAFHYMVAAIGGNNIRCARYETFGTEELSKAVLLALKNRLACLMANHGVLAFGKDLDKTLNTVILVEELCKQYILSNIIGEPNIISETEMKQVLEKFEGYGAQDA